MRNKRLQTKFLKGLLVIMALFSFGFNKVKADTETFELGDTFYFGGKKWVLVFKNNSEWMLLGRQYAGYGIFGNYQTYVNSSQDRTFVTMYNGLSQAEKDVVKTIQLRSEWYKNGNFDPQYNGTAVTRGIYAISAEEFCQYCEGTGYCTAPVDANITSGGCGYGQNVALTRSGHLTSRKTPDRPVYFTSTLSGVNCKAVTNEMRYTLVRQKINNGANVTNFSMTAGTTTTKFSIAGSTPVNLYDITIKAERVMSYGSKTSVEDTGGCYQKSGNQFGFLPAVRLDPTKISGIVYDSANGYWKLGGSTIPVAADRNQGLKTKNYSTSAQTQDFTAAEKSYNINLQVRINKIANPIKVTTPQSGTVSYNPTAAQNKAFTGATGAVGQVTYSVTGKNSSNQTVNYFSIPTATTPSFSIAAGTPAGTYTLTIAATAAGDNNYSSKTVNITYNLTVSKIANSVTFTTPQEATVDFSPTAHLQEFEPASGHGAITYSIQAQKKGTTNVSYFSVPTAAQPKFNIAANTPTGTYTITLRATAAGDNNYNSGTKDATFTLTVVKADNTLSDSSQEGSVIYSTAAQNRTFTAPTTNQGTLTYNFVEATSISGGTVSYFTIPTASAASIRVAAGTPVGQYNIDIQTSAAGNGNYNAGTAHIYYLLTVNKAANPITITTPQSGSINFSHTSQDVSFTGATANQGDVTYAITAQKNASNTNVSYFSIGDSSATTITAAPDTPAGTYTITVTATAAGNSNYNSGTATLTYTLTVGKVPAGTPEPTISTEGIVTWPNVDGAASYQISENQETWTNASSGINYKTEITGSPGLKSVFVKAIGDSNHTDSEPGETQVRVFTVKLNGDEFVETLESEGHIDKPVEFYAIEGAVIQIKANVDPEMTFHKWVEKATPIKTIQITKEWKNDTPADRPASVTIRLQGSDGKSYEQQATAAKNWTVIFEVPEYDKLGREITYQAYEDPVPGYNGSAVGIENAITPVFIATDSQSYTDKTHDTGYDISATGIDNVPLGDYYELYEITGIDDPNIEVTLGTGFSIKSLTLSNEGTSGTKKHIAWTGSLSTAVKSIPGGYTIKLKNYLADVFGNIYDLQIAVTDIKLQAQMSGTMNIALCSLDTTPNRVSLEAYSSTGNDTRIGANQTVTLSVLKSNGTPADGYMQYKFGDIDSPDVFSYDSGYHYYGKYSESVELLTGVSSAIYTEPNTKVKVINGNFFRGTATTNASDPTSAITYTAKAASSSFIWRGECCRSGIVFNETTDIRTIPDNKITNTKN